MERIMRRKKSAGAESDVSTKMILLQKKYSKEYRLDARFLPFEGIFPGNKKREYISIVGSPGCGKSTLMPYHRMLG